MLSKKILILIVWLALSAIIFLLPIYHTLNETVIADTKIVSNGENEFGLPNIETVTTYEEVYVLGEGRYFWQDTSTLLPSILFIASTLLASINYPRSVKLNPSMKNTADVNAKRKLARSIMKFRLSSAFSILFILFNSKDIFTQIIGNFLPKEDFPLIEHQSGIPYYLVRVVLIIAMIVVSKVSNKIKSPELVEVCSELMKDAEKLEEETKKAT